MFIQHGARKQNTFHESKKAAYFINPKLNSIRSFPHIFNSESFGECCCVGRRYRTRINFFVGDVTSYNNCLFHVVTVTLDIWKLKSNTTYYVLIHFANLYVLFSASSNHVTS